MAKVNLNANEIELAKRWLNTIFKYAGFTSTTARSFFRWYPPINAITALVDEIKNRQFTFIKAKLDQCLVQLSQNKILTPKGGWVSRNSLQLAQYIAWFCSENNIIWDDTNTTQYEMDQYKDTILGKALFNAGCFLNTQPVTNTSTTKTSRNTTITPKQPGQLPVNGYKASGAHSGDIPNLVGTPGNKLYLHGAMLCIEADKSGKNTPNAFITPLKATTSSITAVAKSAAEKVNMGSGNGYTDCRLWFDNYITANVFLAACQQKFGNKFNNIHLAYKKADINGYFEVSTEFGNAFIKASTLNEDLEENLIEQREIEEAHAINDIETYDYWQHASIS